MKLSIKIIILCFAVAPLLQAATPRSRLAQHAIPVACLVGAVAIGAAGLYHPQLCLGALGTASHYAGRAAAPVAQYAGIAFEAVRPVAASIFWAGARQVTVTNVLKVGSGFALGKFYYMGKISNAETNAKIVNAECENQRRRADQLQNQVNEYGKYKPFLESLNSKLEDITRHAERVPRTATFNVEFTLRCVYSGTMQPDPAPSQSSVSLPTHPASEQPVQRQETRSWLDILTRVLHC